MIGYILGVFTFERQRITVARRAPAPGSLGHIDCAGKSAGTTAGGTSGRIGPGDIGVMGCAAGSHLGAVPVPGDSPAAARGRQRDAVVGRRRTGSAALRNGDRRSGRRRTTDDVEGDRLAGQLGAVKEDLPGQLVIVAHRRVGAPIPAMQAVRRQTGIGHVLRSPALIGVAVAVQVKGYMVVIARTRGGRLVLTPSISATPDPNLLLTSIIMLPSP